MAVEVGTPLGDWLIWAGQQADRPDPLKVSPASIIDTTPAPGPQYYYRYKKPKPPFQWPKPLWK